VSDESLQRLTPDELAAESGTALPAKEVMSLLDLNANLDLALDTAAPIDLAIGANANIAAPINAAVDANVLSVGSDAQAGATQVGGIHQGIVGDATATSDQHSTIDQGNPAPTSGTTADPTGTTTTDPGSTTGTADTGSTGGTGTALPDPTGATGGATTGSVTDGNLLNVNVNLDGDLHLASPIDGAVAANANAAAPINASAAANIGTVDSHAISVGEQNVSIDQSIDGNATATGDQNSGIDQQSSAQPSSGS
jgi:hypothetical protein